LVDVEGDEKCQDHYGMLVCDSDSSKGQYRESLQLFIVLRIPEALGRLEPLEIFRGCGLFLLALVHSMSVEEDEGMYIFILYCMAGKKWFNCTQICANVWICN
jgi:hypothetical protein